MKYMLDSNIFNRILDGRFSLNSLPAGAVLIATKVQLEELCKTPDPGRRTSLLNVFAQVDPGLVTASFSLDIAGAGLDEGHWSNEDDAQKLHTALESRRSRFNNWHDALIAEAAFLQGCVLVTADVALAEVSRSHGVEVLHVAT